MTEPAKFPYDTIEASRLDDPVVRNRCIKLRCRSELENNFGGGGLVLLIPTFFLLMNGYVGGGRYHYHPPIPALIPFGFTTLAASVILLVGFLGCRNYYLLDPLEHTLYHHSRFFWRVHCQLVFRQGQILAITADCQRRIVGGRYLWYYRMVAVGKDCRIEPLSNWLEGGWEKMSAKGRSVAEQFGCPFHMAPAKLLLSVDVTESPPVLKFDAHPKPQFPTPKRIMLLVFGTAIPLIVFLYYFIVVRGRR